MTASSVLRLDVSDGEKEAIVVVGTTEHKARSAFLDKRDRMRVRFLQIV